MKTTGKQVSNAIEKILQYFDADVAVISRNGSEYCVVQKKLGTDEKMTIQLNNNFLLYSFKEIDEMKKKKGK